MDLATVVAHLVEARWAIIALVFLLVTRNRLWDFLANYSHVELTSKPIKLTLKRLEQEYNVPKTQIRKLNGLTGHDLWALEAFVSQPSNSFRFVNQFNPQRKAIVFAFVEMGLLEIFGEGDERYVEPTKLASDVIDAASKLL